MAITSCRGCNGKLSTQAAACPHCGQATIPIPTAPEVTTRDLRRTDCRHSRPLLLGVACCIGLSMFYRVALLLFPGLARDVFVSMGRGGWQALSWGFVGVELLALILLVTQLVKRGR